MPTQWHSRILWFCSNVQVLPGVSDQVQLLHCAMHLIDPLIQWWCDIEWCQIRSNDGFQTLSYRLGIWWNPQKLYSVYCYLWATTVCPLVRTGRPAWASHTQQTGCWGTEYWGRWWSRQTQGCCGVVLETHRRVSVSVAESSQGGDACRSSDLPTTSSLMSLHSMSPPDSCTMVTAILLWRPWGVRDRQTGYWSVTLKYPRFYICSLGAGLTWCSRKVPWHGIPPLWSTTAGM